jgi:hypothetical protein
MERPERLSSISRTLILLSGIAFALLGAVLFIAPRWSAERFAWKVSPFVAMTIGAWCLGTAAMAWIAFRDLRWKAVHPVLLYLWSFALLELGVLAWFRESFRSDAFLAWAYVATLVLGALSAIAGIADLIRLRPTLPRDAPVVRWIRPLWFLFEGFVIFLVIVALLKSEGAPGRGVFPEPLSAFTVRAFGAFYLSLVLAGIPVYWARSEAPVAAIFSGGAVLAGLILAATLVFIGRFDIADHPLQLLYLGAYVIATIVAVAVVLKTRARSRPTRGVGTGRGKDHES